MKTKEAYCIECGCVTSSPIAGEYPEDGEWFCGEECQKLYEARDPN